MKAWMITNEFLHTDKFTEINTWLLEAAKRHGIEMEIKTNAEVLAVLGSGYRQKEVLDFILFWDKDVRLAKYLEQQGYRVVNSADAISLCDDKSMTHLVLQRNQIPMPKTVIGPMTFDNIGYTNYNFVEKVEKEIAYPMVVKECFGSFGMQVYKVNDRDQVIQTLKKIGTKPVIFQEYIQTSEGRDVRIQVVGNQVITAMYRYSETGDFRANVTNGAKMKAYTPTEAEKALAIQCTKILGLTFAGVDLLFGEDGNSIVCEVNSNAHFKNIFDCTGVNVADCIMEELVERCKMNHW